MSVFTIPLGLGLTAAAHIHLCHTSLTHAYQQYQQHADHSEQWGVDILIQSLSDRALLSELVSLLDQTLQCVDGDENHSMTRTSIRTRTGTSTATRTGTRTGTRTRTRCSNNECTHHQFLQQLRYARLTPSRTISTSSVRRKTSCQANHDPATTNITPMPTPVITTAHQDQQDSNRNESRRHDHDQHATVAELNISVEQIELWVKACRELRVSQERGLQKTLAQMGTRTNNVIRPSPLNTLKTNLFVSLVLGVTTATCYFASKFSWQYLLTSQSCWSLAHTIYLQLPRSLFSASTLVSIIQASISTEDANNDTSTNTSTSISIVPTTGSASTGAATTTTTTTSSSSTSSSLELLPLAPTAFIAGMHILTALRLRWTLQTIKQHTKAQRTYVKRMRLLISKLFIREQRLSYLHQYIKPQQQQQQQQLPPESLVPSSLSLPAATPPSPTPVSPPSSNPFRWLHGSLPLDQTSSRQTPGTSCRTTRISDLLRSSSSLSLPSSDGTLEIDMAALAHEPNLLLLNMDMFIRNPTEQSKVLRMELEALRKELMVFLD
ncbi:hypothetical protein BX616_003935 [Lobosporangium transversale]|uniref:Myosin-binding domain-containing protein n=1 Tax=Lobosporangium transversale TaxID=64571 RepID=A0A1Y2GTB4_9FUNG|nr:hypothetical protein BCR41DRAFT_350390 [Lobosporangium transversale]KAF9898506.1 hypothetical protein BX616_003935 [Lobosporangium transversale]ORZ20842.1 hypothetical protein BCR41DRAFT_350390 [Lobosporangium transversale]|eukprot:XP_021882751.1 hypothetical protein BCR41DRAFT_350390 [Lobosporangium transversale]